MEFAEPSEDHLRVLRDRFNVTNFKKDQWSAIRSVMYDKRDTSIVASTGFGKSLIYQFPPVFLNQLAIVVSPLIALMQDQVASLTERGIRANYFCSIQPDRKLPNSFGQYNVIYITPESLLQNTSTAKLVETNLKRIQNRICLFAIDEAHVVSQWSDFRPEFKNLYKLREKYPNIPILTLTATCPLYIERIITSTLRLQNPFALRTTLNRPNLHFKSSPKQNDVYDFLPYLQNHKEGSAIVYVIRRMDAEDYALKLNNLGIFCKPYHAEIKSLERSQTLAEFRSGELKVVVCTIAFGMGIDRPDVRLVIHYGMPRTIEGYYQEAGRAGRDGQKSNCILFYDYDDYLLQKYFIEHPNHDKRRAEAPPVSPEFQREQTRLLDQMNEFAHSGKCRRIGMLQYLGATPSEYNDLIINEQCCDNCCKVLNGKGPIRLNVLYEDISQDDKYNFSNDLRKLLCCLIKKPRDLNAMVSLLKGELLIDDIGEMRYFGIGRDKVEEWWRSLFLLVTKQGYFWRTRSGSAFKITKMGKSFLRNKLQTAFMRPSDSLLSLMKKRDVDFNLFWSGDTVVSRPKYSDEELKEVEEVMRVLSEQSDLNEVAGSVQTLNTEELTQESQGNEHNLSMQEMEEIEKMTKALSEQFEMENRHDDADAPPSKIRKIN